MQSLAQKARGIVETAGLPVERIDTQVELDMHYVGQTHTVTVPLPIRDGEAVTADMIRHAFEIAYGKAFSRLLPGVAVRIVTLKVAAIGRRPAFDLKALAPAAGGSTADAARGTRQVWFTGGMTTTDIWARLELPVGSVVHGPAILEQPDSTIVLEPGLTATTDAFGNLIITRG